MSSMGMTLYDMLCRTASMAPASRAVVHAGGTITYAQFVSRVDRLAAGLHALGLPHGSRICVLAQNHVEYFDLYLAAAKLGLIIYPINWRLTATEVGHVMTRAEPAVMVYDQSMAAIIDEVRAGDAAATLGHWFTIDGETGADASALETLYTDGDSPLSSRGSDDIAMVISTAAVDVIPRGAALTHENITANNAQLMMALGLNTSDCHLLCLPMFHITGIGLALAMIHCGGCNVLTSKFDPAEAVQLTDTHAVTLMGSFPPLLSTLLDQAEKDGSKLASLRHVTGLEAPDTAKRYQDTTGGTFWAGFGQSETSGFVTVMPYFERAGAAGRPAGLSRVELRDEDEQPVPVGEVGEIVVRGAIVMHSYFAQPDVTEHTFRGGWHHTGDLGRFDEEGYLYYAGRKPEKELIKPGGENVYPHEVESVIDEMDGVGGVCVFGVPDEKWGEAIKAVVEADASAISAADVIEFVGSKIGRFKRPQHVVFVDAIARTEDGAVDRETVKVDFAES